MLDPRYAAEIRRCLLELDIAGMRRVHNELWPGMPQPKTELEALHAMHEARVRMRTIPKAVREYSEAWLLEYRGGVQCAVGVAVKPSRPENIPHAVAVKEAMLDAVQSSIRAGIDIDKEAMEVRKRMLRARRRA